MEEKITRISVSLPEHLLKEFSDAIKSRGYSSRSEAIRNAIKGYITEYNWLEGEEGEVIGAVNVLYDHHLKGASDTLVSLQHEFIDVIIANLHIHSRDTCLELILVRGDTAKIKRLVDKIMAVRGITNVKLVTALRE